MNIFFSLSEGIKSLFKARLATSISIVSVTFTLILLGLFFIAFINLNQFINAIRDKIGLEVFLNDSVTRKQSSVLESNIKKLEGIASITYISKEMASDRFKREFGYDVNEILSYNPLPPSFSIELKDGFKNSVEIAKLSKKLKAMDQVEDVVYQEVIINLIDKYVQIILISVGITGVIIIIIAYALIFNTIRLTIFARRDIIQIMRLVGATSGFIKRPFVIEGIFQGIIGASLAFSFLYGMTYLIRDLFYKNLMVDYHIYLLLYAIGFLIGWISSNMSVHKYLNRV